MPTARELLDQADALMRRNRSPIPDDIPVLTDSVMPAAEAKLFRNRASVPPQRPLPRAPVTPPDSIPTLTERVSPSPPDAVVEEGEPSDWLQLGGGEPSVIGEAPDSIAIVPAVAPPPAEDVDIFAPEPDTVQEAPTPDAEEAFDEELAAGVARAAPLPRTSAAALAAEFSGTLPPAAVVPPEDEAAEFEEEAVEFLPLPEVAAEPEIELEPEVEPKIEPEIALEPEIEPKIEPEPETVATAPQALPKAVPAGIPQPLDEANLGPPDPVPFVVPSPAQDQARWDSVAEEIRMQVLQRIDLFTDTGLREQLGSRLQPIVDRASADLVATINQHVGELLRAYVAEAIEREIDHWKKNN